MKHLVFVSLITTFTAGAAAAETAFCRVDLEKTRATENFVAGKGAQTPGTETLYLEAVRAVPEKGPGAQTFCDRVLSSTVSINAWRQRLPEDVVSDLDGGGVASGVVWYQDRMPGKYLHPEYRHMMMIESGAAPFTLEGMYIGD